jgi:hypothetical protein
MFHGFAISKAKKEITDSVTCQFVGFAISKAR